VDQVVTYDDSNVAMGGVGDVNAQIGDSDTGGRVPGAPWTPRSTEATPGSQRRSCDPPTVGVTPGAGGRARSANNGPRAGLAEGTSWGTTAVSDLSN
jgi:hypothetical protein